MEIPHLLFLKEAKEDQGWRFQKLWQSNLLELAKRGPNTCVLPICFFRLHALFIPHKNLIQMTGLDPDVASFQRALLMLNHLPL